MIKKMNSWISSSHCQRRMVTNIPSYLVLHLSHLLSIVLFTIFRGLIFYKSHSLLREMWCTINIIIVAQKFFYFFFFFLFFIFILTSKVLNLASRFLIFIFIKFNKKYHVQSGIYSLVVFGDTVFKSQHKQI